MPFVNVQQSYIVMSKEIIHLEVAYATAEKQTVIALEVIAGSTVEAAIIKSGILELFPEINLEMQKIGIFGETCALSEFPQDRDRIEIYRPLLINPKEARRRRASSKT